MLPALIFSLILLSAANSVVSNSALFQDGIEQVISRQLSEECYEDIVGILEESNKNFKDLFVEINTERHTLDDAVARNLPVNCLNELSEIFIQHRNMINNLFARYGRSVDDDVPHQIVVEWNKLQTIIAEELPKDCLKNLQDIIHKNNKYFKHLFIGTPRSARSVELQEMMENLFSIPKHLCNLFSNG